MSKPLVVTNREQALSAWDKRSVIVRESGGIVFVYPMLGKGIRYPNFNLMLECYLGNFINRVQALNWVNEKGYKYVVLK